MFTLRCTARLRKRLVTTEETASAPPSTTLGDWYAHLLFTRPQLVLCVSDRTLLHVLVPARDGSFLVRRLREGVGQMLRALGVGEAAAAEEENAMLDAVIGKTMSRQVVGSLNDFASVDTSKPAIRRRVKTGQRGRGVETSWGLPHAVLRRQAAVGGAGDGEGKVRMRSCVG